MHSTLNNTSNTMYTSIQRAFPLLLILPAGCSNHENPISLFDDTIIDISCSTKMNTAEDTSPHIVLHSFPATNLNKIDREIITFDIVPTQYSAIAWKQIVLLIEKSPDITLSQFQLQRNAEDMKSATIAITNVQTGDDLAIGSIQKNETRTIVALAFKEGYADILAAPGITYALHAFAKYENTDRNVSAYFYQNVQAKYIQGFLIHNISLQDWNANKYIFHIMPPGAFTGIYGLGTFIWTDQPFSIQEAKTRELHGSCNWHNAL